MMKNKTALSPAQLREDVLRLILMAAASAIIALNLKSFIQAGDLVPGGFNGLTLLLQRVAQRYFGIAIPFSVINFALNAVPAAVSYRLIGRRFTVFSCVVIVLSSILTDAIPAMPITDDILLISVFGGMINGLAVSLCLRGGATSGGTDFISIALSERLNVDAWNYILGANVVMLMISGALFGWDKALYSIFFQFTSTQTVKLLDPSNKRTTLLIVAQREKAAAVCQLIQDTRHSATLFHGVGLYDGKERTLIYTVVEGSQARRLSASIRRAVPGAFINAMKTDQITGNFYRKPRD